jgi:hypothetical protein
MFISLFSSFISVNREFISINYLPRNHSIRFSAPLFQIQPVRLYFSIFPQPAYTYFEKFSIPIIKLVYFFEQLMKSLTQGGAV